MVSSRALPPEILAKIGPQLEEQKSPKRSKYNAVKLCLDGYVFDSKKEARRYGILKTRLRLGEISDLQVHPDWTFEHNGVRIGRYTADFQYVDGRAGQVIVEDVKGGKATRTEAYGLRKRLLRAFYGIEVTEV